MNEGARAANEANRVRAEQFDRDQMLVKLDRIIKLLEQIEKHVRPRDVQRKQEAL